MSELLQNKISTRNYFVSQESLFIEYGVDGNDRQIIINLFNQSVMKKWKDIKNKKDLKQAKKKILMCIKEYETENFIVFDSEKRNMYVKLILHLLLDTSKYTTKKIAYKLHRVIQSMDIVKTMNSKKTCCVKRKIGV